MIREYIDKGCQTDDIIPVGEQIQLLLEYSLTEDQQQIVPVELNTHILTPQNKIVSTSQSTPVINQQTQTLSIVPVSKPLRKPQWVSIIYPSMKEMKIPNDIGSFVRNYGMWPTSQMKIRKWHNLVPLFEPGPSPGS
jgi:hypothetical protein